MSISEFCCLLQCGVGNEGVYMFSPESKRVWVPRPGEIQWTVEFVLRMHAKHVYMSRRLPSLEAVSSCLIQWDAKIRWMHVFGKLPPDPVASQSTSGEGWWRLRDPGRTCLTTARLPDSWEVFLQEAKAECLVACARSRSFFRDKRSSASNLHGVARLGLQYLRTGSLAAVNTDKDGGFALTSKKGLALATLAQIVRPQYEELLVQPDSLLQDIVPEYVYACKSVGEKLQDEELTEALLSSLQKGSRKFVTKVLTTVKSHKPVGEVSMRLIHSAPQHFMNPAMRWIGWNLKQFLSRQQHILRDSDHLIQLLRSVKVPSTARLVKFDIKDFFMSGHHDDISLLTSKCFPPAVQTGARDLIDSVIRNQVVTVPGVNKYWRVQVGTGMGLRCSGELSDCTFYKLAEEKFATCSEVQRAFGIIFYCRFKDDGFFIIDTPRAKLLEF